MTLSEFQRMIHKTPMLDAFQVGNWVILQRFKINVTITSEIDVDVETHKVSAKHLEEMIKDVEPFEFSTEFYSTWIDLIKHHMRGKK